MRVALLVLALLSPIVASAQGQPALTLTDSAQRADAQALNEALSALSAKVTACAQAPGADPVACVCQQAEVLARLRQVHDATLKAHPDWADKSITFHSTGEHPVGTTMFIPSITAQLTATQCP